MSEIQGKYKININGANTEIYSLKSKKLLDQTPVRLKAFASENWNTQVTGNLIIGKKYFIRVPAHTTNVFVSSLTGRILVSSFIGINTRISCFRRAVASTTSPLCFGFSDGTPECRGAVTNYQGAGFDDLYQLNDADYDFEAFIIYAGSEGNISNLKQFLYTKSTSQPLKYLWLKPYNMKATLNKDLVLSNIPNYYPGTVTAVINYFNVCGKNVLYLSKRSGLDNTVDPIGAISKFKGDWTETDDTITATGALGSYGDKYEFTGSGNQVGYFLKNGMSYGSIYTEDLHCYENFTPNGVGSQDSEMESYMPSDTISFYLEGVFNQNVIATKPSNVVQVTKKGTNSYEFKNNSMSRSYYIVYGPYLQYSELLHIGDSTTLTVTTSTVHLCRNVNNNPSSDYQVITLPTS